MGDQDLDAAMRNTLKWYHQGAQRFLAAAHKAQGDDLKYNVAAFLFFGYAVRDAVRREHRDWFKWWEQSLGPDDKKLFKAMYERRQEPAHGYPIGWLHERGGDPMWALLAFAMGVRDPAELRKIANQPKFADKLPGPVKVQCNHYLRILTKLVDDFCGSPRCEQCGVMIQPEAK